MASEAMSPAMFREQVTALAQGDSFPRLSASQLDSIERRARRVDSFGIPANNALWTATFDLQSAVRMAWRLKAGNAASAIDYKAAEQSFSRSQIIANCLTMAREWTPRTVGSLPVAVVSASPVLAVIVGDS